MTATVCDLCGRRYGPGLRPKKTVTGRIVCDECYDSMMGLTAGVLAGGGDVGQAIATEGWYRRLRKRRRKTA